MIGMEQLIQDQIDTIKDVILKTIPVEQIYLFGSYAYGIPHPDSDLDLYVVMKDDAPYTQLEAMRLISGALWGHKSIPTDILVNKKSRFRYRATAPTLEQEITERGIVIYG
jgi:predicted nucleotidyltransferase